MKISDSCNPYQHILQTLMMQTLREKV